jgi:hypothetical protein
VGVCVAVKKPERYIYTLDFFNVVLVLEDFGQEFFAIIMGFEFGFRGLRVQFERNDHVRTQGAGKLPGHHHIVTAVRAVRGAQGFVAHNLAGAGFAGIYYHIFLFPSLPFAAGHIPLRLLAGGEIVVEDIVFGFEGFYGERSVAERADHLLGVAVKVEDAAALGAFVFQYV